MKLGEALFYAVTTFLLSALVYAFVETNVAIYLGGYPPPFNAIAELSRALMVIGPLAFVVAGVVSLIEDFWRRRKR